MARKSKEVMRSEVGDSREAKIATMIAVGLKNDAIMAAFETDDPILKHPKTPEQKIDRQRTLEAIRSVRTKMTADEQDIEGMLELQGEGDVKSISSIQLANIARFSSGVPALDYIYGETEFIHLDGKLRGQKTGKVEKGLPESFLSIWAGAPGVGKSRLAIAGTKSMNKLGHKVLYCNGEAEQSQFRGWCGADVDEKLFLVRSAESLRLDTVVMDAYKYKPRVIIIDSLQMIFEAEKGSRGMKTALSRFKLLKQDEAAGKPHIIFISQLNKKGELMGSRFVEHMVDFVARVTKLEGRSGQFLFECSRKNRGGATPRSASFRHHNGTVECMSMDQKPMDFNLIQTSVVTGPEPLPVVQPLPV